MFAVAQTTQSNSITANTFIYGLSVDYLLLRATLTKDDSRKYSLQILREVSQVDVGTWLYCITWMFLATNLLAVLLWNRLSLAPAVEKTYCE